MTDPVAAVGRGRATLIGFAAIILWALMALLTVLAGPLPPFQIAAMALTLSGSMTFVWWALRGESPRVRLALPWGAWALGLAGIGGYHLLYFSALARAPVLEANLVNEVWPLLIVLLSALLPVSAGGGRLRPRDLAAALLGLTATALVVTGGFRFGFTLEHGLGYLAAFAAALIWAVYSVGSRLYAGIASDAIGGYCALSAILAWTMHLALEPTVWPADATAWAAVAAIGLGPVGLAFFAWDFGVKHGDLRFLAIASNATPLLATSLLAATGRASLGWPAALACALIVGAGLLASDELVGSGAARRQLDTGEHKSGTSRS